MSGLTLIGGAAGNYVLTQPNTLTANITTATVTITSGLTANNKVYDGTTAASLSSNNVVLSGVLAGDTTNVALSTNGYVANFASATVGNSKLVSLTGLTLTGSAATNYFLTQPALTANITIATVTVASGLSANNKVYDGTTTASLSSNNVVLTGVLAVDNGKVAILTNGYSANFASATVGNNKSVAVGGLTLAGSAATNYFLTQPTALTANITAATVTINSGLTANNKVYEGTTTASLSSNNVVLTGVLGGGCRQGSALDQWLCCQFRQRECGRQQNGHCERVDAKRECGHQLHPDAADADREYHRCDRNHQFRTNRQ